MMKHLLLLAATCLIGLSVSSTAEAQYPCGGLGMLGGVGYYNQFFGSPYALSRIPEPPYFALHPPVYYSNVVPRPYGYSPFAYPGTKETPEIEFEQPQLMENPHVQPKVEAEGASLQMHASNKSASPKQILNPFVDSNETRVVSVSVE